MGRSPDFLNTTVMAFAKEPAIFARLGARYAGNVKRYFEYVRDNDLFLTHALITPQIDRSKSGAEQQDPFLRGGVRRARGDAGAAPDQPPALRRRHPQQLRPPALRPLRGDGLPGGGQRHVRRDQPGPAHRAPGRSTGASAGPWPGNAPELLVRAGIRVGDAGICPGQAPLFCV
jgi:4-hydroxyphenylacetate 3-hydroxylase N terminal